MSETLPHSLHQKRFPNESGTYRAARDRLLEAEMALRRQIEAVAAQRRALPPGGAVVEDYVFAEGDDARPTRMSELFGAHDALVLYNFMYGPSAEQPCPSCTSIVDALDRAAPHIERRAALAVVAKSPIARLRALARARGWTHPRLLSSADNTYNADYFGETPTGGQVPMLNVFARDAGGVRHAYATELAFVKAEPGQDPRHVDLLWPIWGVLDLTPSGRGDFRPRLTYD